MSRDFSILLEIIFYKKEKSEKYLNFLGILYGKDIRKLYVIKYIRSIYIDGWYE